ncbi:nucleotidyltransferase [candidate division WWE3 bacterium CG06_land_8_20_14_3_00_42_16]|uniref:Nucleotidyltransferase n=3 Tax=Katanobacteria TaxID=422282 RepID=A0A2M7ANN5_UNCKA|nr:MAG: hypothetical protein AUJ38_01530 [bacterium CG1_02_42_9]PIU68986.1 MAG: nucleotidyltransferase [candidate division WWE3 bacterium CG06_land_8_20_14_3_00_42_16]PJA37909.1 MAG: nucleotidyltransferase [candidate division WWE3 bacterium CG_4_9_14_3_um_filter_43_9]PJC68094.1 MAG: nucleotidyltransferase [candidate division WWE3 bacterium CG_4_8_14_3_um_filter_42_11]
MVTRKTLDPKVSRSIKRFVSLIRSQGFPIKSAILFGSWAKGKQTTESDIDLCLISPKFGRDEIEELQFLLKQARNIDDRLEPIPLSVTDYTQNTTPLVWEIKKYGLEM